MKQDDFDWKGGRVTFWELHVDPRRPLTEQCSELNEDLVQASFPRNLVLDVGWYPTGNPAGKFRVVLVRDADWNAPKWAAETHAAADLPQLIRQGVTVASESSELADHAKAVDEPRDAKTNGSLFRCPCCHFRTLSERGGFEICNVCFWEDDGQDDQDAELVRGGPNGALSLAQARANFASFGACEERMMDNVRPPRDDER
jgi:hypothetical protein